MLIPGNIPNIIAAHALKIKSTEWAKLGVPLGLVVMLVTMFLLMLGAI
jgi:predicted cation transporter